MKVVDRSKRYRASVDLIDRAKTYSLEEAVGTLKTLPPPKFDQTVPLSFRLGVDPRPCRSNFLAERIGDTQTPIDHHAVLHVFRP